MNYLIDVKPAVTDNSAVSLPETLVHVIMFICVYMILRKSEYVDIAVFERRGVNQLFGECRWAAVPGVLHPAERIHRSSASTSC